MHWCVGPCESREIWVSSFLSTLLSESLWSLLLLFRDLIPNLEKWILPFSALWTPWKSLWKPWVISLGKMHIGTRMQNFVNTFRLEAHLCAFAWTPGKESQDLGSLDKILHSLSFQRNDIFLSNHMNMCAPKLELLLTLTGGLLLLLLLLLSSTYYY